MANYYLGLMSGTSVDGIDIALAEINHEQTTLVTAETYPFSIEIASQIRALFNDGEREIEQLGRLDKQLGGIYAEVVNDFLLKQKIKPSEIVAIGNHGQTVRHRPNIKHPFSLQLGCNQTLATLTNIPVVGDFRTKDIVFGGQGAPLVPAFHNYLFSQRKQNYIIVNLGGIANITVLPEDKSMPVLGFDTGPANCLLDDWYQQHFDGSYDVDGEFAASGQSIAPLLTNLLADPYFAKPSPKSTGREYFNLDWLASFNVNQFKKEDVQATLVALTAHSIADSIKHSCDAGQIILCGGGVANPVLFDAINAALPSFTFDSLHNLGYESDSFEALAFAWLAYAHQHQIVSNIPSVTGARANTTLGVTFLP
ncbi:anhydro-N-acetylmuramic acid kinase [Thalassotalea agarivorans]|uniref:Anhydro-N-acetylmuramic acid kinase n=1 Tax=Thalassotalea agarivorans TaxID=349064 RepID=A0A1I0GRH6_THASX|nr:anhydro-N-acetylmuramic acid kinase [Thalassotalea agarivorans]SET72796.1 anhydro-N-acetylmuramic acid kinase [Thalassotalea agarivorans]